LLLSLPRKRRTPSVQGEQPLHLFHVHFFDQGCVLLAHHDKHCPEFFEHEEHPSQLFHLHFFSQGLECVEHHGLQSPSADVGLGVVSGSVVALEQENACTSCRDVSGHSTIARVLRKPVHVATVDYGVPFDKLPPHRPSWTSRVRARCWALPPTTPSHVVIDTSDCVTSIVTVPVTVTVS